MDVPWVRFLSSSCETRQRGGNDMVGIRRTQYDIPWYQRVHPECGIGALELSCRRSASPQAQDAGQLENASLL